MSYGPGTSDEARGEGIESGLAIQDLTPAALRQEWSRAGHTRPIDIYGAFESAVRVHPRRAAVIDDDGGIDFGELETLAVEYASRLLAAGVRPGDVVAVQLPNSRHLCAVDLAVSAVGAITLPLLMTFGRSDLDSLIRRSRAVAYVTTSEVSDQFGAVSALSRELPALRSLLVVENSAAPRLGPVVGQNDSRARLLAIDPRGPARILVSSGTEGVPKMVVFSHEAFVGGRANWLAQITAEQDPMRQFWMVPLTTGYGSNWVPSLVTLGATLVLTAPKFEAERALQVITQRRPTHIFGVPAMYQMLLDARRNDRMDQADVRVAVSSAAKPQPSVLQATEEMLRCVVIVEYGSSDGVICHTSPSDSPATRHGTAGRPNPAVCTIRIVDDAGEEVAPGVVGEIWARGPMSPMCYLGAPELNGAYRTPDGWVKTGDLGVMDDDGYLSIAGRIKDVINRGGFKVSPAEIESHVVAHPDVEHAACVGMADDRLGERICVFIVARAGAEISLSGLNEFLMRDRGLAKTKLPERLELVDDLPRSPLGKVIKQELRERLGEATAR